MSPEDAAGVGAGRADPADPDAPIAALKRRDPGKARLHDGVADVLRSVAGLVRDRPDWREARVLERLAEPDRVIAFRVVWEDDDNRLHVNRGWRVQHSNAIGPYKGGLRFRGDVDEEVLRLLAFEQTFKNALTGLPMGGAKGGADFEPKGRSVSEIMRFCGAFMTELHRDIGPEIDVPAGDIGVGEREIGFMFGQHKRLTGRFSGALTGKGLEFGGSCLRREATGYGVVHFLEAMLERRGEAVEGLTAAVSGAGNVAGHAAEQIVRRGGRVVTLSDSRGLLHVPGGLDEAALRWIRERRADPEFRLERAAGPLDATWRPGERPWRVPCDLALPCATENEVGRDDVETLAANGCRALVEGANMPLTAEARAAIGEAGLLHGPGKAANLGGVAMSGLEISQNAARLHRDEAELSDSLRRIMRESHDACVAHGEGRDGVDYVRGADAAGFVKVAEAMTAFGAV